MLEECLRWSKLKSHSYDRELAAPDIHSSSVSTPSPRLQHPIVNLPACRQAFLAVLASACDPYLNAIQSVSRKFGESRGGKPALDLFPPRPINRPLNENKFGRVIGFLPNVSVSSLVLGHNVPSNNEEPLTLVSFQSPQPSDVEIDCDGVWSLVVTTVDLTLADAEDLAGRLAEQLRCYGLGPVFLESDVRAACKSESRHLKTSADCQIIPNWRFGCRRGEGIKTFLQQQSCSSSTAPGIWARPQCFLCSCHYSPCPSQCSGSGLPNHTYSNPSKYQSSGSS